MILHVVSEYHTAHFLSYNFRPLLHTVQAAAEKGKAAENDMRAKHLVSLI